MTDIQSVIITVMVSNMNSAIQFYTEVLGLKLINRYGDHWADIEGPGIAIGLHPSSNETIKGNNLQIGLKVPNLEKAISELKKNGVTFNSNDDNEARLATFTDPDGNVLYLVQPQW